MSGYQQQNRGGNPNRPHGGGGNRGMRDDRPEKQGFQLTKDDVRRFIQEDEAAAVMINACEQFGLFLSDGRDSISTTQLRNAYGSMKKLEMVGWDEHARVKVLLIKPRLAYAAGRHKNKMRNLSC